MRFIVVAVALIWLVIIWEARNHRRGGPCLHYRRKRVRECRAVLRPEKFDRLFVYTGEVARGITHTAEYRAEMEELRREHREWLHESFEKAGNR